MLARVGADLADREGLPAVTVSAVAREVEVKPASLYAHVAGSEALRVEVALLALEELADAMAEAVAGRSGRDALAAVAETLRDYARRHSGRYAACRLPLDAAMAARSAGPRQSALLASVLRAYPVPEADHVHAVRLLGATIHGFLNLEAAQSFAHSAPEPSVSWERVVERLDASLASWPTP